MELPPLPQEFSAQARKKVVDAEIIAARILRDAKPVLRPLIPAAPPSGNWILLRYVMSVFVVFAHEACAMSRRNVAWPSDKIDRVSRNFLRQMIVSAQAEYHRTDFRLQNMTSHFTATILPEVMQEIEKTEEWKTYQDLLLKAEHVPDAVSPTEKPPMAVTASVSAKQRLILEPDLELLKSDVLLNKKQAARALGVSPRTLDRYVADRRLLPSGDYVRRKFKTKDLRSFVARKDKDK